jgi:hypothetical protein
MIYFKSISWETTLDAIGILLCGFIIVVLLFNKIKYRRLFPNVRATDRDKSFKADIRHHILQQQLEKLEYLVTGPLTQEIMILKEMVAAGGIASYPNWRPEMISEPDQEGFVQWGLQPQSLVGVEPDPYVEVPQLYQDGLSPRQISEKAKLPLGEVELLLKLYAVR